METKPLQLMDDIFWGVRDPDARRNLLGGKASLAKYSLVRQTNIIYELDFVTGQTGAPSKQFMANGPAFPVREKKGGKTA